MLRTYKDAISAWVASWPDGKAKRITQWLSFRVVTAFVLVLAALILFTKIALEVREPAAPALDTSTLLFIHEHFQSDILDKLAPVVTNFAGTPGIMLIGGAAVALAVYKRHINRAAILILGVGGAIGINLILKNMFGRLRPEFWDRLVIENDFSFPSGHSMAASALAFSIIAALWYTRWRIPAVVIGGLYVTIIGLSRLYLGVHYPTDIVGAWLMSFAWVGVVFVILNPRSRHCSQK